MQIIDNKDNVNYGTQVELFALGAGQDIGRSCIIIKILDKQIMMDCGLHMTLTDNKKYPDFNLLQQKNGNKKLNQIIDVAVISHFHLDHCGALPFLTEKFSYSNPVIMSTPTRALLPYMLEDYRKVSTEQRLNEKDRNQDKNDKNEKMDMENEKEQVYIYSQEDIKNCCNKVQTIQLMETIEIKNIKIKSYYAGHVLGACMFLIEYQGIKVLYTGDFNSNADRHLGGACIDKVQPDIIITETTYATLVRDSKRARESEFLKKVQETIDSGGKILIPVFALGRAQELCVLLESYWQRVKNTVPIYFAGGLIEKANFYYKLFVNWENEKIQESYTSENVFDFKHILPFDKKLIKSPQPMVLLATPGMLHGGQSMQIFKEWCGSEKNVLIIPGYCVPGTLGNKLLSGTKKVVLYGQDLDVKMQVEHMSFSAHADAKGIINLIRHCEAKQVVLVHGEKQKMQIFSKVVQEQLGVQVHMPANFETIQIKLERKIDDIKIDLTNIFNQMQQDQDNNIVHGLVVKTQNENYKFVQYDQELKNIMQILNEEQVSISEQFCEHQIVDGNLIQIHPNLIKKYKDKEDLLKHIKNILETTLKKHEKTVNNYEEYLNSCELKIKDEFLLIEIKSSQNDQQLNKKAKVVFDVITKYNNGNQ